MIKYIVMVETIFGTDDTLDIEYSGVEHELLEDAIKELQKAAKNEMVLATWIKDVERM